MYKAIIAIGIAAAVCLAAGCGSSGEETAEAAVTKAQFIKQASAVCEKRRAETEGAVAAWEKETGKQMNFEVLLKQILGPSLKQEAEELSSLPVPQGDEAKVNRMIENLSKAAAIYAEEGAKLRSTANIDAYHEEARAYGDLESCWV